MQSLVLSQLTGKFPPFTLLNCSGLLWKLLLMSKTIQKLAQTEWRSSTNPYNIYQHKLWFTKSVNYFLYQKLLILDIHHVHLYRLKKKVISLSSDAHTGYCKQFWSEQSDKCRYSCNKNPSQWGCVSTRPLFLSASALSGSSSDCCVQHLSQVHFKHLKSKVVSSQTLSSKCFPAHREKKMPSGHITAWGRSVMSKPMRTAVLLYESGTAYVICHMHVLYENVQYVMLIQASAVLHCYVCWTRLIFGLLGSAALRRRRARLWRWAAAASWSGSSWSHGEWPSPGPRRTPWGPTEAWWAPAWRSHCWNAARKYDQAVCEHGGTDFSHIFFEARHDWYDVIHWDRFIFVVFKPCKYYSSHDSTAQAKICPWPMDIAIIYSQWLTVADHWALYHHNIPIKLLSDPLTSTIRENCQINSHITAWWVSDIPWSQCGITTKLVILMKDLEEHTRSHRCRKETLLPPVKPGVLGSPIVAG